MLSGCITSAESVLITAQSVEEFYSQLNGNKTVVISISPQSRASLAAYFNLDIHQVLFFKIVQIRNKLINFY